MRRCQCAAPCKRHGCTQRRNNALEPSGLSLTLPSRPHVPPPQVLPSLQVEGHPHMFALGDVNNVPETKLGFLAAKQAELAAASLQVRAGVCGGGAWGL